MLASMFAGVQARTLLDVKHAAQLSVGPSVSWMTVARMGSLPRLGASTETKVPSDVPVANPLGSSLTVSKYCKYPSALGNSGSVSGVSVAIFVAYCRIGDEDDIDDDEVPTDDGEMEAPVNAEDRPCAARITKRRQEMGEDHIIVVLVMLVVVEGREQGRLEGGGFMRM
jgi:hypothetical protein